MRKDKPCVLKVEDVTMQFGGVVAVNNFSMEEYEGEIVAIIGPNGAGKTTAFNVITGVYAPTNGRVSFNGERVIENYPRGKMKKAYLGQNAGKYTEHLEPTPDKLTALGMARTFQNIRLWKSMTVFENVLIAKHLKRTSNVFSATFGANRVEEQMQRDEADALIETVGLADVRDELATSLPYGKQRRLEIARALATEPKLLLLDEPAAGMNPQETVELTKFIGEIRDILHLRGALLRRFRAFVLVPEAAPQRHYCVRVAEVALEALVHEFRIHLVEVSDGPVCVLPVICGRRHGVDVQDPAFSAGAQELRFRCRQHLGIFMLELVHQVPEVVVLQPVEQHIRCPEALPERERVPSGPFPAHRHVAEDIRIQRILFSGVRIRHEQVPGARRDHQALPGVDQTADDPVQELTRVLVSVGFEVPEVVFLALLLFPVQKRPHLAL